MSWFNLLLLIVLTSTILITGCSQGGESGTTTTYSVPTITMPAKPVVVQRELEISNLGFTPNNIEVNGGELLLLTINSVEGEHTLTMDAFGVDMEMPERRLETIQLLANRIGTFEFYCRNHPNMRGQLIVKAP